MQSVHHGSRSTASPVRVFWAAVGLLGVLAVVVAAAVALWSGATLKSDPVALARIELQPFAGKLVSATAAGPDGKPVALNRAGKRLTPSTLLTPGETVTVDVVVKRPGGIAWALGAQRRERLTIQAPVAHVTHRWLTATGSSMQVGF